MLMFIEAMKKRGKKDRRLHPLENPIRQESPIYEPDSRTAHALVSTLKKKLGKTIYERYFKLYWGRVFSFRLKEILFFSESTLDRIAEELRIHSFQEDKGFFNAVYLGYRCFNSLLFTELNYKHLRAIEHAQGIGC